MKVCFIICTNSDLWFSECRKYIENLIIPENVEIEIIGIENASSMAGGYAVGCSRTNADYKVYLHQDTFIINRHFIEDIDRIFRSNDEIGVIGMIGSNDVAKQNISWGDWECGKVIVCNGYQELKIDYGEIEDPYRVV
ncbi:MAG: glycosyltransferase family protein, partial [Acetatifactor sp.]|nr:glycosyltransferase family protein [Acetatifactor sp.]